MLRNSKRSIDRVSPVLKRKKMTFISEILEPPTKSQSDKKEYRLIKLPNGMKSLLIQHFLPEKDEDDNELSQKSREINDKSDPESSQESSQSSENEEESEGEDESSGEKLAAVALCINAGSFSDPVEVQGLFHFLEHMIFMGSEKFPKENDYDQFISNNGGFNNAHTECEYTLYQFEIVDDELEKALDIFAQLFISPLMLKDSIQREAEAVESEFQQNLIDDDVRIQQFYASLANGPASIFTWGNQATLTGKISNDKLYEMVHEYRKKFYLANKMFLCVESALGLDELQTLIESKFNAIQRGPEPVPYEIPTEHFKPEFFNKMYFVKPKADKIKLYLTFQLPSMQNHYRSKPHDYVSFILQHEGVGSLTSYLKKRLYILSIEAGSSDQSYEGNSLYSLFSIEVLLTTAGEKNLDEVLKAIFSCLLMLKITSDGDHRKVFEEVRSLKETQFKYVEEKSPTDNAENLAVNMHYFDSKDIITGTDLYLDYDPIMIRKVIEIINEPKFNLLLLTEKDSQTFDKTEKWFGTKYKEIGKIFEYYPRNLNFY
jgi:nardilysin